MRGFSTFVAIDWSGAIGARQRGIAIALCRPGDAVPQRIRPGHMWSREEVLVWLCDDLPDDSIVGFDFGPSLPFCDAGAFFPGWNASPADARGLWDLVESLCADDPYLSASSFVDHPEIARHLRRHGGRTGDRFGGGRGRLRITEEAQRTQHLQPCSGLNIVGAAQVGKASLTGMRVLHRIQSRVAIWPFDPCPSRGTILVEIYTSLAARDAGRPKGRSKMTTIAALNAALAHPDIASRPLSGDGDIDDHGADAILTAAWLRRNAGRDELWHPPALTSDIARTEGWTFGVA